MPLIYASLANPLIYASLAVLNTFDIIRGTATFESIPTTFDAIPLASLTSIPLGPADRVVPPRLRLLPLK